MTTYNGRERGCERMWEIVRESEKVSVGDELCVCVCVCEREQIIGVDVVVDQRNETESFLK